MQSLKTETENAMARADQLDAEFRAATSLAEKTEESVRDLQKKMQHVENELDITLEKLTQTATKLDKLKAYALAEGEIKALKRKISLLEDELERSESKGTTTTKELSEASALKDSIDKALKTLETKNMIDEQRIDISENQLKEAKQMVEESDIKYDEVARKLAMVEGDLERAEERAEGGESKIVDLEEELRVIGENLKALEVAEEKAQQREEEYKKQIKVLAERWKKCESDAEYGEKTVQKLNLRIDGIMADLVTEKMKTENFNEELDYTFEVFMNI